MTVADDRYKEMNAGVALLLERMKTNPEEFYVENINRMNSGNKWDWVWQMYGDYLSKEDQEAYINGLKEINQQRFAEIVMEGIVSPNKPSDWELANVMTTQHSMSVNRLQATISALGTDSITLSTGNTSTNTVATPIAGVTQTI